MSPGLPFPVSDLGALAASLRGGSLLPRDSAGYDRSRRVWNAAVDHHPLFIVRCGQAADAATALRFAIDRGLPVSVRGGGHSVAGHSVGDGAMMIDLSALKRIDIDADARRLTVQGGVTWGEVMQALAPYSLATPGAFNHSVGVAGLTLGGGYGALTRAHGLACDNLIEARVVTAGGESLIASETENVDLFWALRGAGANFGVATSFTFRLHPLGPVLAGSVVHPLSRYREVLRFYRDYVAALPEQATAYLGMKNMPRQPGFVFVIAFHAGSPAAAESRLAPLRSFGPPASADFRPRSYLEMHDGNVEAFPAGYHNYWKTCFMRPLQEEAIDILAEHAQRTAGTDFYIAIEHLGGAMARLAGDATAFAHRDAPFGLAIACKWRHLKDSEPLIAHARALHAAMRPFSTGGVYVNYLGADHTTADARAAYGVNLPRLSRLKRLYDPANLLRFNVNIPLDA